MCQIKKYKLRADKKEIADRVENLMVQLTGAYSKQEFHILLTDNWNGDHRPGYTTIAGKLNPDNPTSVSEPELVKWAQVLKPVVARAGIEITDKHFLPNRSIKLLGGGVLKFFPSEDVAHMTPAEIVRQRINWMERTIEFYKKNGMDKDTFDPETMPAHSADDWAMNEYMVNGFGSACISHVPVDVSPAKSYKDRKVGYMRIINE